MSWLELKLRCSKDAAATLEAHLWESGAVSVTMIDAADEPLFEPGVGETPLWHDLVLTGLYAGDRDAHEIQLQLASACAPEPLPPLHFEILPEQDWVRSWLDDFKPMRSVGAGVFEIRVRTGSAGGGRAHRVFYVARFAEAVYVLHAFEKKSQKTARKDIETGRRRYAALLKHRDDL